MTIKRPSFLKDIPNWVLIVLLLCIIGVPLTEKSLPTIINRVCMSFISSAMFFLIWTASRERRKEKEQERRLREAIVSFAAQTYEAVNHFISTLKQEVCPEEQVVELLYSQPKAHHAPRLFLQVDFVSELTTSMLDFHVRSFKRMLEVAIMSFSKHLPHTSEEFSERIAQLQAALKDDVPFKKAGHDWHHRDTWQQVIWSQNVLAVIYEFDQDVYRPLVQLPPRRWEQQPQVSEEPQTSSPN